MRTSPFFLLPNPFGLIPLFDTDRSPLPFQFFRQRSTGPHTGKIFRAVNFEDVTFDSAYNARSTPSRDRLDINLHERETQPVTAVLPA